MGYEYTYDWDGKVRKATPGSASSGAKVWFKYDPMGNRIFKQQKTGTAAVNSKYILDTVGDLPVILLELDGDDGDAVKKTHIYAGPQVVCSYVDNTPASKYFYLADRLGSVRLIVNTDGDVLNSYSYLPFGAMLESDTAQSGGYDNNFKFTGQWHDEAIDQYYLRARQYSPQLMRFTSRDKVFGEFEQPLSIQKYIYCLNDPIMLVDPEGLWAMYLTGVLNAQMGLAKGMQAGLVWDDKGNIGIMKTRSDGVGTPSVSAGIGIGWSGNAESINDLSGWSTTGGGSGGFGIASIGFEGFECDNGISGFQLNLGVGLPGIIGEGHVMRSFTTIEHINPIGPDNPFLEDLGKQRLAYRVMLEDSLDEQFWNIRSQGEAYGWNLSYDMLSFVFDKFE